jgi:hypothetical protein
MLYIYRRRGSTGARDLTRGILLQGTEAFRTKGRALRNLQAGDVVVCWGDHFQAPANIRTLNNVAPISKFTEAQTLAAAGVATIKVSRTRPAEAAGRPAVPAVRPAFNMDRYRGLESLQENVAQELVALLRAHLDAPLPPGQPAVPATTWLARRNTHVGGNDLLAEITEGDFYSQKEDIIEEYRLHMFGKKSLRAGKKVQRAARPDGSPAHDWIRSFDAGWIIQYDGFRSTREMRTLAAAALKALGLDFAAVDLGRKRDGSLIVLEVNRAPGVEGNTINAYARKVISWAAGRNDEGEDA